jgi:predicted hotdog family 3-hydroxylacyl-ACP dehydratase
MFPTIEELVPHRGAMSLLRAVKSWDPTGVVCDAIIDDGCPFLRDGRVHSVVALEYMAQAAAVWSGLTLRAESKAQRSGFLVSVPEMKLAIGHFALGDELSVRASQAYRGSDSAAFDCSIELRGERVASARVTTIARGEPA